MIGFLNLSSHVSVLSYEPAWMNHREVLALVASEATISENVERRISYGVAGARQESLLKKSVRRYEHVLRTIFLV